MLDPLLLTTFATVAKTRSFTAAAQQLGLGQSTVSQHIQRLEAAAGRRLLARDTHSVGLTPDGEAMLSFAQSILDVNERAHRYFEGSELRGQLRFGASEDFVFSRLPEVLRDFRRRHPSVDLELTVALSGILYEMLDAGQLDLVLAKRRLGEDRGRLVRREQLVWAAANPSILVPDRPLPLIAFPPPSVTRALALEALDRAHIPWRIVCTCGSLSGLRAAALAGLGILVQPRSMVPAGLTALRTGKHLPMLDDVEFVVIGRSRTIGGPAEALATQILNSDSQLQM
ncbi:MAG: LysR substrate-binding domain-containing protein [Dongiaceae bacterium]